MGTRIEPDVSLHQVPLDQREDVDGRTGARRRLPLVGLLGRLLSRRSEAAPASIPDAVQAIFDRADRPGRGPRLVGGTAAQAAAAGAVATPGRRTVLAESLITVGVLAVVFVLWALYLSDIPANRAAAGRVEEFTAATVPPITATDTYERYTTTPPAAPDVAEGETLGVLYVPRFGTDYEVPIAEGTSTSILNQAVAGHYVTTEGPGEVGNFAVAGHRTTYGKIFHDVEELAIGEPVVVRTENAWLVYTITSKQIVEPSQNDVIASVPGQPDAAPTARMLTLTTCHPLYGYSQRYIVHAELDHWVDPAEGTPVELGRDTA